MRIAAKLVTEQSLLPHSGGKKTADSLLKSPVPQRQVKVFSSAQVPDSHLPPGLELPAGMDYAQAQALLKQAIRDGKDALSLDRFALVQAVAFFEKALQTQPENFYILGDLGFAHFLLKEHSSSLSYYKRAVEQAPGHPLCQMFYNDMGTACQELKDILGAFHYYGLAVEITDKAKSRSEQTSFAYKNRALLFKKNGLYPQALEDINRALEIEGPGGKWTPFYQKVRNELRDIIDSDQRAPVYEYAR